MLLLLLQHRIEYTHLVATTAATTAFTADSTAAVSTAALATILCMTLLHPFAGKHSLETIVLLLALKIQFPTRVFLVRGNHESPEVNARDGFLHECVERLGGKNLGVAAWRRLNLLFEWMPLGAVVNGCILCVHGGIGRNLTSLEQIAMLQRPLRMGGPRTDLLLDLMWSDPTSSDDVTGVHINPERGSPVVCYGPDRVHSFLKENRLSLIVRAHECVMDGFQRFAGKA